MFLLKIPEAKEEEENRGTEELTAQAKNSSYNHAGLPGPLQCSVWWGPLRAALGTVIKLLVGDGYGRMKKKDAYTIQSPRDNNRVVAFSFYRPNGGRAAFSLFFVFRGNAYCTPNIPRQLQIGLCLYNVRLPKLQTKRRVTAPAEKRIYIG